MAELPTTTRARGDALTKIYPAADGAGAVALDGVDVDVFAERLLVVAGPSGSGKSTLLNLLALVEQPTRGTVTIDDVNTFRLSARGRRRLRRRTITYLFARPTDNLVGYLDAGEQLVLAAQLRGQPRPDVRSILGSVGLADHANARPWHLSGGEQQRLAVATAIAAASPILLADEPTSDLDRGSATAVVDALRAAVDQGAAVVAASHDQLLIDAADDVIVLRSDRRPEQS